MRVMVTRPREDAEALTRRIQAAGHEVLAEPLLEIRYLEVEPPDLGAVQAVLATSANGVRALARAVTGRQTPLFAVGGATARTAREQGFAKVRSAGGDVAALAALVRDSLDAGAGPLLQVAASRLAGDLAGELAAYGFEVERAVLYEALAPDRLSARAVSALTGAELDAVVFFSPRTARVFVRLAEQAGAASACPALTAYCFSAAVAEALGAGPGWKAVEVAVRPNEDALLVAMGIGA